MWGREAEVEWSRGLGGDLAKLKSAFEFRERLFGRMDWLMEESAAALLVVCGIVGLVVVRGVFGRGVEQVEGGQGGGGADSSILLIIHKEK